MHTHADDASECVLCPLSRLGAQHGPGSTVALLLLLLVVQPVEAQPQLVGVEDPMAGDAHVICCGMAVVVGGRGGRAPGPRHQTAHHTARHRHQPGIKGISLLTERPEL